MTSKGMLGPYDLDDDRGLGQWEAGALASQLPKSASKSAGPAVCIHYQCLPQYTHLWPAPAGKHALCPCSALRGLH